MNTGRIILTALSASILAIPAMADAPGYFKVPGTETTMQVYGRAQLNAAYVFNGYGSATNNIYGSPDILFPDASGAGVHQSQLIKNQWDMDVSGSRIGIQTMTPSSFGDVQVKFEGDFFGVSPTNGVANKALRVRHFYGKIGGLTVGQTWSIFADGDSSPAYLDQDGLYSDFYGNSRVPQVSYSFSPTEQITVQVGVERDRTGGTDKKFPGALVAALGFASDWGHVRGAVAYAKAADFSKTGTTETTASGTHLSWNVGANYNIMKGSLTATVRSGVGFYGTGYQDAFVATGSSIESHEDFSWQVGYSQPITDAISVAAGYGNVSYKQETFGTTSLPKLTLDQYFVNMTYQATKQCSFGVEYFGTMVKTPDVQTFVKDDLTTTDKADAARLNFQVRYTFF